MSNKRKKIYSIDIISDDENNNENNNENITDNTIRFIIIDNYCKNVVKYILCIIIGILLLIGVIWFLINKIQDAYRIPKIRLVLNISN